MPLLRTRVLDQDVEESLNNTNLKNTNPAECDIVAYTLHCVNEKVKMELLPDLSGESEEYYSIKR